MAIVDGLLEKMLMIDEPIFCLTVFVETAPNMEKFSIPQVSGTHTVSVLVFEIISEHCNTSSIDRREPKLHAIRMKIVCLLDILVYLF
jgi:hypothetical protein